VRKKQTIESPFASSLLGKQVAQLCEMLKVRPCTVLGIQGSPLERLLWDIAVMSELEIPNMESMSVSDKIRAKRRRLGIA